MITDANDQGACMDLKERNNQLLAAIKARLPELERLLEEVSSHWGYEDPVYRFYYQSFKVLLPPASHYRRLSENALLISPKSGSSPPYGRVPEAPTLRYFEK